MDHIAFLTSQLAAVHLYPDDNDNIGWKSVGAGDKTPVTISKKRLVLPTKNKLSEDDWDGYIAFAPFNELSSRGKSEVLSRIEKVMKITVYDVMADLIDQLLDISTHNGEDLPSTPTPEQIEVLSKIAGADKKTIERWRQIVKVDGMATNKFMTLYLTRNSTAEGKKYVRYCKVKFPIIEQITEAAAQEKAVDRKVYGIQLRKTPDDTRILKNVFECILPGSTGEGASAVYSVGTMATTAPNYQVLYEAYYNIIRRINAVVDLMAPLLENPDELHLDTAWHDDCDDWTANIEKYSAMCPVAMGNEGTISLKETVEAINDDSEQPEPRVKAEPATAAPYQEPRRDVPEPAYNEPPVRRNPPPSDGRTLDEVIGRRGREPYRDDRRDYDDRRGYDDRRDYRGYREPEPRRRPDPYSGGGRTLDDVIGSRDHRYGGSQPSHLDSAQDTADRFAPRVRGGYDGYGAPRGRY